MALTDRTGNPPRTHDDEAWGNGPKAYPEATRPARAGTNRSTPLSCKPDPMTDRHDLTASFLALVDEAFRRLMDEPDAHLQVTVFAEGEAAFVPTRVGHWAGSWPAVTASSSPVSVDW